MNVQFKSKNNHFSFDISYDNFWDEVSKIVNTKFTAGDVVEVIPACGGRAEYQLVKSAPTHFVREINNTISIPQNEVRFVYLVKIDIEHNNYKFYSIEDYDDEQILVKYGRIGTTKDNPFGEKSHLYPKKMYNIKLQEKLAKGYVDKTSYYKKDLKVTNKEVRKTEDLIKELESIDVTTPNALENFNNTLQEILAISPRDIGFVSDCLAKNKMDVKKIIYKEKILLNKMKKALKENPDTEIDWCSLLRF